MDWLSKIIDIAKLPTKFFSVAALVAGLVVFLPQPVIEHMGLVAIRQIYGPYFSISFIVCISFLSVESIIFLNNAIARSQTAGAIKRSILEKLDRLDSAEKSVLREFYFDGSSTIKLPINHPVVAELHGQRILEQVGSLGEQSMVGILISFRLARVAREYIKPENLGISVFLIENSNSNWMISDEGVEWVRNNRPPFVHEIYRRQALLERRNFYDF
jgi:hypothetical protein